MCLDHTENGLPPSYIAYLDSIPYYQITSIKKKFGASLFLAMWFPILLIIFVLQMVGNLLFIICLTWLLAMHCSRAVDSPYDIHVFQPVSNPCSPYLFRHSQIRRRDTHQSGSGHSWERRFLQCGKPMNAYGRRRLGVGR